MRCQVWHNVTPTINMRINNFYSCLIEQQGPIIYYRLFIVGRYVNSAHALRDSFAHHLTGSDACLLLLQRKMQQ